jgi:hypothetical protein
LCHPAEEAPNRIYLAAQVRAIENGTEEITEGLLRSAYRDDFRLVSHIIETLKSGGPSLLNNVRDVCPPAILTIKQTAVNPVDSTLGGQDNEEVSRTPDAEDAQVGPAPQQNNGAAAAVEEYSIQRDQIFPSSVTPNVTTRTRRKRSKTSKDIEVNFEENDLRGIVALGQSSKPPVDPYRALLAAGYIKDSSEFLSKER